MHRGEREIFVVHGHNTSIKSEVAGTIEKLGLRAVILHEQANGGRTIVEKLEREADVAAYAVVVATADDVGRLNTKTKKLQPRARQNVVLELGYFIGKLGRHRVAVLCETGIELPSDLLGVLYIPIDEYGAWKLRLSREISGAGIPVDFSGLS